MSELVQRRQLRPGLKGYSPEPTDPLEARDILNLQLDREGIWKPRPGLLTRATMSGTIRHLSNRPRPTDNYPFAMVEGSTLRIVNTSGSTVSKDTGWPTGYGLKHCFGQDASGNSYWIAPKCNVNANSPATPYRINPSGSFAALSGSPPTCRWVEGYGQYVFAIKNDTIHWSDAGDADSWTASSYVSRLPNLDVLYGFVSLSESQAIIIATSGTGIWTGNSEDIFQQGELFNIRVAPLALTAVKCGERVLFLGPGPRVYSFHPSLERIDGPVNKDLDGIADSDNVLAWFDPVDNYYCIADFDAGKTYLYDVERNIWVGRLDKALVGIGLGDVDAAPFLYRFYGYGTKFCQYDTGTYTDDGSNMTIAIETAPDNLGLPSTLKQMSQVYVDGEGSWTVGLYGRSNPQAAFSLIESITVDAPGWGYFGYNDYVEMTLRLSATATSSHRFRGLEVDERIIGVAY